jgi:purine-nucleoside phosphorylase
MSASQVSADARIRHSVETLRARAGAHRPRIAVLLGSGWSPFAEQVLGAVSVPYADLPAFPTLGVEGHDGRLLIGRLAGHDVLVLCGRRHAYEDGDCSAMNGAIRSLAAYGIELLVQTTAAGSLDPAMRPGSLMLLADHLNLVQRSPLFGDAGSRRFVDLRDAYDPALRDQARAAARRHGATLHEGTYAWVMGPQFETPAEIRMLGALGAQAVGMSTVPETIVARHAGLRVMAVAMLTNMACGLGDQALSHEHTLATARAAGAASVALLVALLTALEL